MTSTGLIDTHHHVIPPDYRTVLDRENLTPGGMPVPAWSMPAALAMMDGHGIATSVMSLSAPGVHFGDNAKAAVLARQVNEYAAERVKDRPDRFGFFATLTLPDVDHALTEAAYALDELHADGVVLLANSHGTYLGDPAFAPLIDELGRRGAVVFIHPGDLPGPAVPGCLPSPRTSSSTPPAPRSTWPVPGR